MGNGVNDGCCESGDILHLLVTSRMFHCCECHTYRSLCRMCPAHIHVLSIHTLHKRIRICAIYVLRTHICANYMYMLHI